MAAAALTPLPCSHQLTKRNSAAAQRQSSSALSVQSIGTCARKWAPGVRNPSAVFNENYRTHRIAASASSDDLPSQQPGQPIDDPYKVLGVTPLSSFDQIKMAHKRKQRDAEVRGDSSTLEQVDQAYDAIMMRQLTMRKQGVTFGSVKVSSEIKYADSVDVLPWKPRYEPSDRDSIRVNAAVSILGAIWAVFARSTDWKVVQLLTAFYVFRFFLKLAPFYPPSDEEGEKKWQQNGRRLLRSLGLVFGSVLVASLGYSAVLQVYSFVSVYVPRWLFTLQELIITLATSVSLFYLGSYYR